MDSQFKSLYNSELHFLREVGAEFAAENPRIAGRLGMNGIECLDPYVERLLEGVAFLAARIQLKLAARHPDFTQHLLELIYPHFLCPVPSCGIVEIHPELTEGSLVAGVTVPRDSALRTPLSKGQRTACEFRTAHDVTLWPIEVVDAKYIPGSGALAELGINPRLNCRAAIQIRLASTPGVPINATAIDALTFHLKAVGELGARCYEQIVANTSGLAIKPVGVEAPPRYLQSSSIRQYGFDDDQALFPATNQSFQGYRLLQEYFALPERFLFFQLRDLRAGLQSCSSAAVDLYILLERAQPALENALDPSIFRLNCVPVVNLFPRALDRMQVTATDIEHHIVPDRNRPLDFELSSITRVVAVGSAGESALEVVPFYSTRHRSNAALEQSYYTMQRRPRLRSSRERQQRAGTGYAGSDCFVSVVGSRGEFGRAESQQLDITAMCTNRDLPIGIVAGSGSSDFELDGDAPVASIRLVTGPTKPRQSPAFGDTSWRLISHLALNYHSLLDTPGKDGAELLREMLRLYADPNDNAVDRRQIDGVQRISHESVVRRIPGGGPVCFARGLLVSVQLEEEAFEGIGILPLGSVLDRFFSKYVSLNSFVQTRVTSQTRGQVKQWPVRIGTRHLM